MKTFLIVGALVIAAGLVLYLVMKPTKTAGAVTPPQTTSTPTGNPISEELASVGIDNLGEILGGIGDLLHTGNNNAANTPTSAEHAAATGTN